jgi:Na+/melibiose symporter-like transporter
MRSNFSDRLLSIQQDSPDFRERYEREVKAMFEKQITPAQRYGLWIFAILCFAASLVSWYYYFVVSADQPKTHSAYAMLAVIILVWGIIAAKNARKKTWNVRVQAERQAIVVLGSFFGIATILLLVSLLHPGTYSSNFIVAGLVLLVIEAVFVIRKLIQVSEMNTKEKLLKEKLLLADLAEKPEKK